MLKEGKRDGGSKGSEFTLSPEMGESFTEEGNSESVRERARVS